MAAAQGAFDITFAQLRQVMLDAAAAYGVVSVDEPGNLIVRTQVPDPKTGQPGWFGTVTIKKSYVAYHLIPLYDDPALADGLSDGLTKRRQGKTCFNFGKPDPVLFEELRALSLKAAA